MEREAYDREGAGGGELRLNVTFCSKKKTEGVRSVNAEKNSGGKNWASKVKTKWDTNTAKHHKK